jgi:hypothetical protein
MLGPLSRTFAPRPNPQNKVNKFRKRLTSLLASATYGGDETPYHVDQDNFMARCKAMEAGKKTHDWIEKVDCMDLEHDL